MLPSPTPQRQAIEDGRIRLRGRKTTPAAVLKNGDWQSHIIHRHEPPVAGLPIFIAHECDDFVSLSFLAWTLHFVASECLDARWVTGSCEQASFHPHAPVWCIPFQFFGRPGLVLCRLTQGE